MTNFVERHVLFSFLITCQRHWNLINPLFLSAEDISCLWDVHARLHCDPASDKNRLSWKTWDFHWIWVPNVSAMSQEALLELKNAPEMQDCVRFIRLPDQLIQWCIKRRFIPVLLWNWLTSRPPARGRHRDPTQARSLTGRAWARAHRGSARRKVGRGHSCSRGAALGKVHLFFNTSAGMTCEGCCVLHIVNMGAPMSSGCSEHWR